MEQSVPNDKPNAADISDHTNADWFLRNIIQIDVHIGQMYRYEIHQIPNPCNRPTSRINIYVEYSDLYPTLREDTKIMIETGSILGSGAIATCSANISAPIKA